MALFGRATGAAKATAKSATPATASGVLPASLQAGRRYLLTQRPYLAHIAWAMQPVAVPDLIAQAGGAIATDARWRLYYDPAAVASWDAAAAAGALYHECMHLLRAHMTRGAGKDARRWNLAGDCEINDDLLAESFVNSSGHAERVTFPYKGVSPATFGQVEGKLAEEYYEAIGNHAGKRCGSGATGQHESWEIADGADGAGGDGDESGKRGTPGVSKIEATLIRRQVANAIQAAKARGDVPEHLQRWAGAELAPVVDWRKVLAAAVRAGVADAAGRVDYTYRRPSRRAAVQPEVVLPALRQPVPAVAVVADTSGSMGDAQLQRAIAEVKGVLRGLGLRDGVRFIACDAAVHSDRRVASATQAGKLLAGGGGTDMGVGIAAALANRPAPDVVVVLTDGYTPWPSVAPRARVVVGLIGAENGESSGAGDVPSWARVVRIPL